VKNNKRNIFFNVGRYPEFSALIAFIVLFSIFALGSKNFISPLNLGGILSIISERGILIIGVAVLMIAGEFDLSVGTTYALSAIIYIQLLRVGHNPAMALLISIAIGIGMGFVNGIITLKVGIPSFITTLGTGMFFRGFVYLITKSSMNFAYEGDIPILLRIINGRIGGQFRTAIFWTIGILIFFFILLTRTKFGNAVYAVGGNKVSAQCMGINVFRIKLSCFIIAGVLAALAGAMAFTRLTAADPLLGKGMELEAVSAAVIGGISLYGGYGSIIGSFLGTCIISIIGSGLVMIGMGVYWYQSIIGLILIVAVTIFTYVRRIGKL